MAFGSLLTLLDDLAMLLDDVAALTKVAAKKTAGVLGDDLALNAQQVAGVDASRELPVVWAVAKGSMWNKVILVPAALVISAVAPWAVTPLLIVGGLYLCFEGAEKIAHTLSHRRGDPEREATRKALSDVSVDMVAFEREKIRGAVRTDFVLSAEIVAITLGTVAKSSFATRVMVLSASALIMTVGVYGLVAAIVKLDDAGLALTRRAGDDARGRAQRSIGRTLLAAAPWLMKTLSVLGTAAMFLVGGGILTHGIHTLHEWTELVAKHRDGATAAVRALVWLALTAFDGLVGVAAGALLVGVAHLVARARAKRPA